MDKDLSVTRKGMTDKQERALQNIKKLISVGKYSLYSMKIEYDYLIDDVIKKFTDLEGYIKSGKMTVDEAATQATAESLNIKISKDAMLLHSFGCTAFKVETIHRNILMGRNYDFKDNSSGILVYCNPNEKFGKDERKGYKSVAFAPIVKEPVKNSTDNLMAPFSCVDGINEMGVSIAILVTTNNSKNYPTYQYNVKDNIFTTMAVRLVLDRASTIQEAVDLIRMYDMFSLSEKDYHFFISDAYGDSVVVEYDYEKNDRDIIELKSNVVTNFYLCDNKEHTHGFERYKLVKEWLSDPEIEKNDMMAWNTLNATSQKADVAQVTSNTQWSVVYNNITCMAEGVFHQQWNEKKLFRVETFK